MNIIGVSGIEGTVSFKRAVWPDLEERDYRISQGHDAAAALVIGGTTVAAAAEERFNRHKHSGHFPVEAIEYCLSYAGLNIQEIDAIVHAFDYTPYQGAFSLDSESRRLYQEVYSRDALLARIRRDLPGFPESRVHSVEHHRAHAASAYYTSGWDQCLTIVLDGMGEVHGATIFAGRDGQLEKLAAMPASDSIGILYSLVTLHLGFEFNSDEYKIMGLAPYGDPNRFRSAFEDLVLLQADGTIRIPLLRMNTNRRSRENYANSRAKLGHLLGPARHPDDEIGLVHCDIAAALQECLGRVVEHTCSSFSRTTGLRRLALAGGVALNCAVNGRLLRSGLFEEVYIQPAAGDDGAAAGAALHYAAAAGEIRNVRFPVPYLGPEYTSEDIATALTAFEGQADVLACPSLEDACDRAAAEIAQGHVVAWYRGRMEYGPRALGRRSILADPGVADMRQRINAMVKMREAFRPFAPAVSLEEVDRWFDVPPSTRLPYMIATVDVRPEHRQDLPAVTHVDGSARVQTVEKDESPEFHRLLQAVGRATGREMVLNTSFNVKGQPIVNTPAEAIDTFLRTDIDVLFMENFMLTRRDPSPPRQTERAGALMGLQKA